MSLNVIIPSKSISNLTACVAAVRKHEPSANIVVVDDTPSGEDLDSFCLRNKLDWSRGKKPFIFSRACNHGIELSEHVEPWQDPPDIVLLNDDALLETPGGFSLMQRAAEKHPEYGIISATTNLAGNPAQRPQGVGLRDEPRTVAFVCVLIPRRTIDRVGLLDERFTAYGFEDNDYCRRVREAGLKIGINDGCFVDHGSLTSTFRGSPTTAGDIWPAAEIYRAKWGDLE